jgi:hypothetical protein
MQAWQSYTDENYVTIRADKHEWQQILRELNSGHFQTDAGDDFIEHLKALGVEY